MQSKDPESVAIAIRLALAHLVQMSKQLQMADVIQSVEERAVPAPTALVQLIAAPEAIDWVQVRIR